MVLSFIARIYASIMAFLFIFTVINTPFQRKIRSMLYWFVKKDGLLFSVAFLATIILYPITSTNNDSILDVGQFSSIAISVSIAWVVLIIKSLLIGYLEDQLKLTDNYEQLVQKYKNTKWLKNEANNQIFPVIKDADLYEKDWKIIDHAITFYKLPDEIHGYEPELMAAHKQENNYNSIAIRVCEWKWDKRKKSFLIHTSRTTYYNSLMTNRAMDFRLKNGYTVRDLLSYGPSIPDLEQSKLSNQIGVNGFLVSEGCICLIYRGKYLAIGKRTYGTSISGDLHTRFKKNSNNRFKVNKSGIFESIRKIYIEELRLREYKEQKDDDILDKNSIIILAAYRDIVEGNKPQFLTYVESPKSKKEIEAQFNKRKGDKYSPGFNSDYPDGEDIIWIKLDELKKENIYPSKIVVKEKKGNREYAMVPSASASVLMFVKWADENPKH